MNLLTSIMRRLPEFWFDAMVLTGFGMCFYGLYLCWPPLAWIICGAALIWYGLASSGE
jgi:hypothetical protein